MKKMVKDGLKGFWRIALLLLSIAAFLFNKISYFEMIAIFIGMDIVDEINRISDCVCKKTNEVLPKDPPDNTII